MKAERIGVGERKEGQGRPRSNRN